MAICKGCGGVLGRDCWNEMDCLRIGASEESQRQGMIEDSNQRLRLLEYRFALLVERLSLDGFRVNDILNAELVPPKPQPLFDVNDPDLPF